MAETLWHTTLEPDTAAIAQVKPLILACFEVRAQGLEAMLACDEVLTNIAMYSGATTLDVTMERDGQQIRITFSDDGTPFDPLTYVSVERDFEDWDQGGLGIHFVKQTCDDLSYAHTDGRNVLTLSFSCGQNV